MPRTLLLMTVFLALAAPAALAAPPADKGGPAHPEKTESAGANVNAPGQSSDQNAAKKCKAERGTTEQSIAAFKAKYGTNANKANAFGKCVSALAKKATDDEETTSAAEKNAAKKCKAERGTTSSSIQAFTDKYGTNKNKANAFGKCVAKLAKEQGSTS